MGNENGKEEHPEGDEEMEHHGERDSKEILSAAQEEKKPQVDLNRCGLKEFPEEISAFQWIKKLDLRYNSITEIPSSLAKCNKLASLDLSGNSITSTGIPDSLANLGIVECSLNKQNPPLESIPRVIFKWTKLKKLFLWKNALRYLPKDIGALSHLRELDLSGNKIHVIPSEVFTLTKLFSLNLMNNGFSRLPSEVQNLARLKVLDIQGNDIDELPTELAMLSGLQQLSIKENPCSRDVENKRLLAAKLADGRQFSGGAQFRKLSHLVMTTHTDVNNSWPVWFCLECLTRFMFASQWEKQIQEGDNFDPKSVYGECKTCNKPAWDFCHCPRCEAPWMGFQNSMNEDVNKKLLLQGPTLIRPRAGSFNVAQAQTKAKPKFLSPAMQRLQLSEKKTVLRDRAGSAADAAVPAAGRPRSGSAVDVSRRFQMAQIHKTESGMREAPQVPAAVLALREKVKERNEARDAIKTPHISVSSHDE